MILCVTNNDDDESLANVDQECISRVIYSVVGMLDQADKTVKYLTGAQHGEVLDTDEVLVKLKITSDETSRIDKETKRKAVAKLLSENSQALITDNNGEEVSCHISKFSIQNMG